MARRTRASVVKLTSDRKEGGHHYHLYNRTVRKGFFFEEDGIKTLTVSLLRDLNSVYALEICRYALMDNHYHLIVRWQPEWVSTWSDAEVVRRWFRIHPPLAWATQRRPTCSVSCSSKTPSGWLTSAGNWPA